MPSTRAGLGRAGRGAVVSTTLTCMSESVAGGNAAGALARPEPSRFYRWTVLIFVSLAMFGNYYVYDALSPLADLLVKARPRAGFLGRQYRPAAGDLQFPEHLHGLDRRHDHRPHRLAKRSTLLFGVLCLIGPIITVAQPHLAVMAAGRLIFGTGGGIADCGGDRRAGPLVPRQGTELRLRHQSDDRPAGIVCRAELSDLGKARLRQLALPVSDLRWDFLPSAWWARLSTGSWR